MNEPIAVPLAELPGRDASRQFEGAERGGGAGISFYEERTEPGGGPPLHRHPYAEVFIVHEGDVEFEVAGEKVSAEPGMVITVPPATPHRFTNVGGEALHMSCIHDSASMEQENL